MRRDKAASTSRLRSLGAAVNQELERLVFLFERLENRAAIHDLPAALIGEADYEAIGSSRYSVSHWPALPTKSDYLGQLGDVAIDRRTFDEKTLVTEDFEECV